MTEAKNFNTVWEETFRILKTVATDEHYVRRWAFVPPNADVRVYAQAPFTLYLAIESARVVIPDSVLKELGPLISKLKERLLKITGSLTVNAQEVVRRYEQICWVLEEIWVFLSEKILHPGLRAHFLDRRKEISK